MVSTTRWRQDRQLAPPGSNQRVKFYVTYPSGGGGYSAFGWTPVPLADTFRTFQSPDGVIPGGGLSGLRAPAIPTMKGVLTVLGAIGGIFLGRWAARANLET